MRSYVIDVESVPAAPEVLEARMPEELRNPVIPESIANPAPPLFSEGCPAYASIKDDDAREAKREAWMTAKMDKWQMAAQEARQKWELSIMEARTKFTQNAALDAKLGHAKLIGMKDAEDGTVTVWVWEQNPKQMSRIRAWERSKEFPTGLLILPFMEEGDMIAAFFSEFKTVMESGDSHFKAFSNEPIVQGRNQCVTYCGNSFDFPFLYRRSWLTGAPQVPLYRRGRYWDESRMVDLRDLWTFGSREDKDRSGGLDNLAAALGYERPKLHHGADFHRFYQEDPTEGIAYLLSDLDCTLFAARKMGVVR